MYANYQVSICTGSKVLADVQVSYLTHKINRHEKETQLVLYVGKSLIFCLTMAVNPAFAQTIYHGVTMYWSLEITMTAFDVPCAVKNLCVSDVDVP